MMGKRRVIIVGMDGCTFTILKPLMDAGKLPTLSKMAAQGVAGPLMSVTPPITPAAWSSFYTGKNPGKHGVYEFLYRRKDSYLKAPVNYTSIRGKKFWDYADAAGLRSCLFNLPLLYPTPNINGIAISGLLTPDNVRDFGTPAGIIDEIETAVGKPYVPSTSVVYTKGNTAGVLDEFHRMLTYHIKTAQHLLHKERWDLFFSHFMVTDSMQHELWHLLDPTHSAHDPEDAKKHLDRAHDIYVRIDQEFLKPLVDNLDDDTTVLVMSDHGFGGIEHIMYMNMWLLKQGYIAWNRDWWTRTKAWMHRLGVTPRNFFKVARALGLGSIRDKMPLDKREVWQNRAFMNIRRADWSRTKAYSMGNILGMLYLNIQGREPEGCVRPTQAVAERDLLIEKLRAERLPNSDQPMFADIIKNENLYDGPYAKYGPDIVTIPTDWRYQVFGYQDFVSNKFIEPYAEMTGHHRPDGIFFGVGSPLRSNLWLDEPRLMDVGPTVMHLLGLPIPTDLDGRVLEEIFTDDAWEYPQTLHVDEAAEVETAPEELSEEEQKLVLQRLKALGYED